MQESSEAPIVAAQVVSERTHIVIPSLPHWIEPTVEYNYLPAMRPEHPGGFEFLLVLRGGRDGTIVDDGSRRDARGADNHTRRRRFASRISGSDLS